MAPQPKSDQPAAAAPPSHGEQMNRMNLLLAKHVGLRKTLRHSSATSDKRTPPSTPPTIATDAPAKKPKTTFSALKNSSAASTLPSSASNPAAVASSARADEDEILASENAGLGFVPAGKQAANDARTAATRDLRGKLLGKRAREQKEDAAAARRKKFQKERMGEDESDEDVGRSAVGKGGKKARKTAPAEEE